MKEYACDKLNSLLDETYKTIAEKEISKVIRVSTERKLQKPVDVLVEERYERFRKF
jgi:hypothetical protein